MRSRVCARGHGERIITKRTTVYFTILSAFSIWLILAEFYKSQDFVRLYVTDILGPGPVDNQQHVPFYAVNTTITVCLQLGTALLFFLAERFSRTDDLPGRERYFLRSQVILFAFLGCDDRFLLHEALGLWLHVNDALILALWGAVELAALFLLGRIHKRSRRSRAFIYVAATLFAVMVVVDGLVPETVTGRLAFEDLLKTWACMFLFLFGMHELTLKIEAGRAAAARRDVDAA